MLEKKAALFLSVLACTGSIVNAASFIDVGNHLLLPNTPNQKIELFVTGDAHVQAAQVYVQIGIDPASFSRAFFNSTM